MSAKYVTHAYHCLHVSLTVCACVYVFVHICGCECGTNSVFLCCWRLLSFCMKLNLIPVIALLVINASSLPVVPTEHKLVAICTDSLPVIPAGCKVRGHICGHISFLLMKLVEHARVVRGSSLHFKMIIYMYIYML